ncbi:uncharacterized protein PG986_014442 [Apiospora aurea]|uniref:Uncharacterized protein n=1 Tax=Apiospora aurea TaxID=335848 RepID=A0ABR1PT04_9PEZI
MLFFSLLVLQLSHFFHHHYEIQFPTPASIFAELRDNVLWLKKELAVADTILSTLQATGPRAVRLECVAYIYQYVRELADTVEWLANKVKSLHKAVLKAGIVYIGRLLITALHLGLTGSARKSPNGKTETAFSLLLLSRPLGGGAPTTFV